MDLKQDIEIKEFHPDLINPNNETVSAQSKGAKIIVIGKPGCFARDTGILMYDGSVKPVQDVEIGDKVMGDDSTPRTVLNTCRGMENMHTITPVNGDTPYVVNENHYLVLKSIKSNQVIEIKVNEFLSKPKEWCHQWRIFKHGVTVFNSFNPHILYPQVLGDFFANDNPLIDKIDKISSSIRDCFTAQYGTRLRFLAGIIDSIGSYDKHNNIYIINTTDTDKINKIQFLAKSLGFTAIKRLDRLHKLHCHPDDTPRGHKYNLHISNGQYSIYEIPSKLRCFIKSLVGPSNMGKFTISNAGVQNYYGFTVDGNNRFLLDTFDVVRNSGKSNLIKSLLYYKKHLIPSGILMSGTEDSNNDYKGIFPPLFIYNEYDEQVLEDAVRRQKLAVQHLDNPWSIILLDDCTDDPASLRRKIQHVLYKYGRHHQSLYILSLQYSLDVKPFIRSNTDGIFIFREPNNNFREILYKNYASIIPDYATFCKLMDELTTDHTALYIHNMTTSNNWQDCVFYYKAPNMKNMPDFKIGCRDYWKFAEERYNEDYKMPL